MKFWVWMCSAALLVGSSRPVMAQEVYAESESTAVVTEADESSDVSVGPIVETVPESGAENEQPAVTAVQPVMADEPAAMSAAPELDVDVNNNKITVVLKNAPGDAESVVFPVWTEVGGQDDISWYTSEKIDATTWRAVVDIGRHNYSSGEYNIHAYEKMSSGELVLLAGTKEDVKAVLSGNISIANKNDDYGSFTVQIQDVAAPFDIQSIAVPVWSEKNGQDDIQWYYAKQSGDLWTVNVSALDHQADTGRYNIHVYYIGSGGQEAIVGGTQTDVKLEAVEKGTLSAIQDQNTGKLSITYSGIVPQKDAQVFFPVWTEYQGQDDIHWYQASKINDVTWKLDVDLRGHNYETGQYNVHAYVQSSNGDMQLIGSTAVNITDLLGGSLRIVNKDMEQGKFTVLLENVKAPFDFDIKVPIWSSENGQDDLLWYDAHKNGNTWSIEVDLADHYYVSGTYNIHLYYVDPSGNNYLIQGITENIKLTNSQDTRLVARMDNSQTEMTVNLYNARRQNGVTGVLFAVWSEANGQDDLSWYGADEIASGTWKKTIHMSQHNGGAGLYNIHAYKVLKDGNLEILTGTTVSLTSISSASGIEIADLDAESGQFRVQVSGISSPAEITDVFFPVWSDVNGQDDVRWYRAQKNGDCWYADIQAKEHGYDSGIYNIHCYAYDSRGVQQLLGSTTKNVSVTQITDGNISSSVVATSWIVYDISNGRTIYSRNPDGIVQLASQTKIMTAMVVLDHVKDLDATVTMTSTANSGMSWDTTVAGLVVGRSYTVRTLLEGLLVYSGGDCAGLLAEYVAGSKTAFVQLMNEKALELGMNDTEFADPVGLYDNHTTPREYMKLVKYADQNAVFRDIVRMPSCVVSDTQGMYSRRLLNSNSLVSGSIPYDSSLYVVDGMKTGTTDSAGYCLTASGTNSSGRRIVAAVFNSSSYTQRAVDARTLLNHGFSTGE